MPEKEEKKGPVFTTFSAASLILLGALVSLLIAEFTIAQFTTPRWLILIFAVAQAGIILWEYMHVKRMVGSSDEEK